MKLSSLMENMDFLRIQGTLRREITGIFDHSEKCCPGGLFVAVRGKNFDGHLYLKEAIENGARVCLVERLPGISYQKPKQITLLLVADTRKALAHLAGRFYPVDFKRMKLIGITGTKGKTSVAYMIREGLMRAGIPVGMIGSNGASIGAEYVETENTTPGALELHRLLHQMEERHCSYVVMEVSSQSVMQRRVYELPFALGIFTNFAADHIGQGEHHSVEEYWFWKCQFLRQASCRIVNQDCPELKQWKKENDGRILTFGSEPDNSLQIVRAERKRSRSAFWMEGTFVFEECEDKILIPFPFYFQIANAAAASLALKQCAIRREGIREALMHVQIPGRCELVYSENSRYIMIDYAHNAYSMKTLLAEFKEFSDLTIISLFGCGGGRARMRRSEMGQVSGTYADLTIITEDNSRMEPTEKIIEEIRQGVESTKGRYLICKDRRSAIRLACTYLKEHSLLLVLGKGREHYMETAEGKLPYSDYETIQKIRMEGGI